MVNFRRQLSYYHHILLDKNSKLTKQNTIDIANYLQENLNNKTFQELQQITETNIGTVNPSTKIYSIDIIYALDVIYNDRPIHTTVTKSNLSLPEFVFLVNALRTIKQMMKG